MNKLRVTTTKIQNKNHMKSKLIIKQQQMNLFSYIQIKKLTGRVILSCIVSAFCLQSQGQIDQRLVKADQYFAAGDYYTAAHLYEQFLTPNPNQKTYANFPLNAKRNTQVGGMGKGVTKNDILYRQAESYRLANYWPQAASAYKKTAETEPSKYAAGLYWYAICQRSLGNYADAEESLNHFLSNAAAGDPLKAAAEKELQTLIYIKTQLARPDTVMYHVQKLTLSTGADKGVYAPVHVSGDQFLITSTETDTLVKEGVSPYHNRLYTTTLSNGVFQQTELLSIEGSETAINQGAATVNPKNGSVYFTQWKQVNGQTISSLYYATKTGSGLSTPVLLGSVNSNGYSSKQPFCTSDGKYLFFASDKPGGAGKFDIWYAPINADGTTGDAVNAGATINTAADELAPFYHSTSNTLVFSSNGKQGMGGYDLFMSKGSANGWKTAENMGHPVNSVRDDIYFYAPENQVLLSNAIFSSDRGSSCCLETYTVAKTPKKKIIKGIVRDLKDNQPVDGATVVWKDASGKTGTIITGTDGSYQFELDGNVEKQITVTKELYKEKSAGITVTGTDESDLFTDKLSNTEIFIEKKLVIKVENVVTVYFDFDMSNLKTAAVEKLDSIYTVLVEHPTATIQISGYTDGLGSTEYNAVLSDKRARACADYLIAKGIDTGRITFESFGACCPVEMELLNGRDNAEGRSKNRRALININKE